MKKRASGISILKALKISLGVVAFSGLANSLFLLSIPSGEKNSLVFSLSPLRLLLLGFLLAGSLLAILAAIRIHKQGQKAADRMASLSKNHVWNSLILTFWIVITAACWLAFFSPAYFLGRYYAIMERLRPMLLWLESGLLILIILGALSRKKNKPGRGDADPQLFRIIALAAILLLLIFAFIAAVYPRLTDDLWFGRYHVPILATQIVISGALVLTVRQILNAFTIKLPDWLAKNFDWIVFVLIWGISAACWLPQPIEFMQDMFFTTIEQHLKPLPPTFEIQPWKDSRTYYFITESVKIGRGIYRSIDKPLFLTIASILNWIAGGSYLKMLDYQTVLLALFPPVVYLIGKTLYGRTAGFLAALLAIFQELNGLRIMDEFPVVSAKVLLSEPYMQLWTALIILFFIRALKKPKNGNQLPFLISGSVLGFSALFRLNTIIVIPFLALILTGNFFERLHLLWKPALVFLLGILLALTPWMMHNAVFYNNPFAFMKGKVEGVILRNRYDNASSLLVDPESFRLRSSPDQPIELAAELNLSQDPDAARGDDADTSSLMTMPLGFRLDIFSAVAQLDNGGMIKIAVSVLRHFLNNLTTSFSILPTSIIPQDLFHGSRTQKFWGSFDAASYTGVSIPLVLINLLIIAAGIGVAIRKNDPSGWVPAAVYAGYHLSNGLALSSGNRYAQPATWVVFFYYAIGLMTIGEGLLGYFNPDHPEKPTTLEEREMPTKSSLVRVVGVVILILAIGSSPVIADTLPPLRYPKANAWQIAKALYQDPECRAAINQAGYASQFEFLSLLKQEGVTASIGKASGVMRINQEQFEVIFPKSKHEIAWNGAFITFSLIENRRGNPPQLFLFSADPGEMLQNGSDVLVVHRDGFEVLALGVVRKEGESGQMVLGDLNNLTYQCIILN